MTDTRVLPLRLNVAQASEQAKRHPDTIRRALDSGELHGAQRARYGPWSILAECLEAWISGHPCAHQSRRKGARRG